MALFVKFPNFPFKPIPAEIAFTISMFNISCFFLSIFVDPKSGLMALLAVPGEDDTHSLGDEGVHQEEHETVEKDGNTVSANLVEGELTTIGLENHTGAES